MDPGEARRVRAGSELRGAAAAVGRAGILLADGRQAPDDAARRAPRCAHRGLEGDRITDVELLGYIYGFVTAGSDTTGTSFVNAFSLLAEFDQLDYARGVLDDQEALRKIVEEVLRFGTPFPTKPLFVLEDSRFGELMVPAGSVLQVWFAAANRDEAVNGGITQSDPHDFDPQRWPNRHVGLGWAGISAWEEISRVWRQESSSKRRSCVYPTLRCRRTSPSHASPASWTV